jgi:ribosome-associated protein
MMAPDVSTDEGRSDGAKRVALAAARGLDEAKCEDIVVIDVRNVSQVTDFIVVGSGTSDRQMRTAAHKAEDAVKELGEDVFRSAKDPSSTWVVLDFVDVVVHVFEPQMRAHYDLEMLWGDGPHLDWRDTAASPSSSD